MPLESTIDSAFADYIDQFEVSLDDFLADVDELEEEGFDLEEVLAALAALSMAD